MPSFRLSAGASAGLLLALSAIAPADAGNDAAARGAAVAEQWCRMCHLHKGDRPDPDMAPPFEEIVLLPGRDEAYFVRFLKEDHFPMTTFRLFDHEKADVVAWLMELQRQQR